MSFFGKAGRAGLGIGKTMFGSEGMLGRGLAGAAGGAITGGLATGTLGGAGYGAAFGGGIGALGPMVGARAMAGRRGPVGMATNALGRMGDLGLRGASRLGNRSIMNAAMGMDRGLTRAAGFLGTNQVTINRHGGAFLHGIGTAAGAYIGASALASNRGY